MHEKQAGLVGWGRQAYRLERAGWGWLGRGRMRGWVGFSSLEITFMSMHTRLNATKYDFKMSN